MTKKEGNAINVIVAGFVVIAFITAAVLIVMAIINNDRAKTAENTPPVVAVDTESLQDGRITIFKNGEFFHFDDIVSYVDGDPGCLYPKGSVVGEFIITNQSTGKTVAFAILENGETVQLETQLHRLPLSNASSYVAYDGGYGKVLVQPELDDTFSLTIAPSGKTQNVFHSIVDYSVAYDTIYWMDSYNPGTVWYLDWTEDGAEQQVYCENAYGVSHHTDEAQGALVPRLQANYTAYGRYDIYSPYGIPYGDNQ